MGEMEKLKAEADTMGKGSFAFAFYMDKSKEERARGVTIACTTKEFYTDRYHYTIIDAPGHRDFIKNMITGASQADVAVVMVPADGNFTTAIAKGNHKAGVVQGQTRQHARLINLLGVKQLVIGVNKMDCDVAKYSKERYTEIKDEMVNMLCRVGWKKSFVAKSGRLIFELGGISSREMEKLKAEADTMGKGAFAFYMDKFEPQQPFVCDSFKQCEGLGRIAIMEGNGVVMLGKVVKCEAALDKK